MIRSFELSLFADFFQFYLQDEAAIGDLSDSWDKSAVDRLLAIAPGIIGVGTVRNMDVPVVIEIHGQEPDDDFAEWDYVIEAGLDVPSGRIMVAGCTDYGPDALRLDVPPGSYRARISYGALDALSEDELSGDDHYRVQMWPELDIGILVRKQLAMRLRRSAGMGFPLDAETQSPAP